MRLDLASGFCARCDSFRAVAGGLEIEVKLRVGDLALGSDRLAVIKARLEEMGASLAYPREFEDNLVFDFPDRSIVRTGSLLRVRILSRGTLVTFKGPVTSLAGLLGQNPAAPGAAASGSSPASGDPGSGPASGTSGSGSAAGALSPPMKARHETELTIPFDETDALLAIIRGLGMQTVFRYQKYRTTWEWQGLHIMLDETPIGIYVELEGDQASIEAGAKALGYRPDDYIARSYRDLYLEHLDRGGQGWQGSRSPDGMLF